MTPVSEFKAEYAAENQKRCEALINKQQIENRLSTRQQRRKAERDLIKQLNRANRGY